MLDFSTIRGRLLAGVRMRVRNGEITERNLARRIGLSQPHVHNVLKGEKSLKLEVADLILKELGLSVLDFVEEEEWRAPIIGACGPRQLLHDRSREPAGQSIPN